MSLDAILALVQYAVNMTFAAESCFMYSRVLQLRSSRLFSLVFFAGTTLTIVLHHLNVPSIIRLLTITVPMYFVFPLAWSTGPLGKRLLWTSLSPMVLFTGEWAGTLIYGLFTGEPYYTSVTPENIGYIMLTYAFSMLFYGSLTMLLVALHDRLETNVGAVSTLPFAALLLWSFVVGAYLIMMWNDNMGTHNYWMSVTASSLTAITNIVLSFATLALAHSESKAIRERQDAAALVEQTAHMRAKILATTQHSVALRQLRHDLATQMGSILGLEVAGQREEAMRKLKHLQNQARAISSEGHEDA